MGEICPQESYVFTVNYFKEKLNKFRVIFHSPHVPGTGIHGTRNYGNINPTYDPREIQ